MIDVSATTILILILLYLEFQQQHKLAIKSKSSKIKIVLAIVAAILLVTLFWSTNTISNIRLVVLAVLIASIGLYNQGLGKNKVVTYGSIMHASAYSRYDRIITETIKQGVMVTFWSQKGGSYFLIFDQPISTIRKFLKLNLPQNVKLLTSEEFGRLEEINSQNDHNRQVELLKAIRNRPQRNRLPWQKKNDATTKFRHRN
ncbi:hypothetical protein QS460_05795 [Liquorilactobacillus mali]|uniref:DUF5673 domain-containing protein n=1 Tax=Liquorilactobacillus mali TaxID=1618 RepID=A0A0R2FUI8_9LACO|nr:hypothetical protein [Liquorilactobacillus mali]KRN32063.1 hypothetical protein IV36_GL001314 [Liquorilactobacillus mali]MDN7145437.1 hypothetical protein [Liquorilactobacillus mali]